MAYFIEGAHQKGSRTKTFAKGLAVFCASVALVLSLAVSQAFANPLDDAIRTVSSLLSGDTSERALGDYTESGVSPRGTTINVFDYWITSQDANDQSNPDNYQNLGINQGHVLKFGAGMGNGSADSVLNRTTVNQWTQSSEPRTGIVDDTLGSDGYPTLSSTLGGESLSYLFNSSSSSSKAAYTDVDGLLQVDSQGYYYYDSKDNFAEFNSDGNGSGSFTLYDTWGVAAGGSSPNGQFFPFNTGSQVFNETGSGLQQNRTVSTDAEINHYFGLSMSTRFVQQNNGHTDTEQTKDVTYNFSGDDDVWIYIDDVLVGDLGGIHNASSIEINFSTGIVRVYDDDNNNNQWDNNETIYNGNGRGQTLHDIFQAAGKDVSSFNGNTFANDTYHTLDFFYLERGNTDSNMSLKYNLVNIPESGVVKVDQDGDTLEGVTYQLYPATVDGEGNYTTIGDAYYTGTTDANGELTFTTTDGSGDGSPIPVTLEQLEKESTHWILREAGVPDGYRDPGDIWLRFEDGMLLSSNPWDTGTYAQAQVTVTAADTLYERNSNGTQGSVVQTNDQGFIFAVVMQKQSDGSWSPVYGNAYDGWTVSGDESDGSAIAAAQQDLYRFTVGSGGAFQVDIDNLPGDITTYEYVLANSEGGNPDNAKYTIAYYYTSADDINSATADNTTRLYVNQDANTGAGGYEGFDRVFSVTLNVSNIKNELTLHKTNADGSENLQGTTYTLYNDVNGDGDYDAGTDTEARTGLITDENGELQVWSGTNDAGENILANGNYVPVETAAPEGYQLDDTPIQIVVDDDGVHVNAGTADDNVTVETGLGTLAWSMKGFAAGDHVDATLHDVQAQPQTATSYSTDDTSWSDVTGDDATAIHLQYENDGDNTLDYALAQGLTDNATDATYTAEAGWSRLNVTQCLNHDTEENALVKQDLGNQSLNALFTGDVTIHVTNELTPTTGSLRIDKDVTGTGAPTGAEFTYTLNLTDGDQALSDSYTITKYNSDGTQSGEVGTIANGGEFTLQNGQYVVIEGLPDGISYSVTEAAKEYYTPSVAPDTGDQDASDGLTSTGTITSAQQSQVTYTNNFWGGSVDYDQQVEANISKLLTGRDAAQGENFSFELKANDEVSAKLLGMDSADSSLVFSISGVQDGVKSYTDILANRDITFTADNVGTYSYTISEQRPAENPSNGTTYDEMVYTLTITASADETTGVVTVRTQVSNETGVLQDKTGDANDTVSVELPFENSYRATGELGGSGSASIKATKVLENDTLEAGNFTFNVAAVNSNGTDERVVATATNGTNGAATVADIVFPAIQYDSESLAQDVTDGYARARVNNDGTTTYTYLYRVYEDTSGFDGSGLATSQSSYNVTVRVTDDGDGTLEVSVEYPTGSENGITFTNVYGASANAELDVAGTKIYETNRLENAPDITGDYTFTLTGVDEEGNAAPLPDTTTATNQADGTVDFGTITYDIADLGGADSKTFTYTVTESGGVDGVTNDAAAETGKTFEVTLTDNGDGTISVDADAQQTAGFQFSFTNEYSVDPTDPSDPTDANLSITKTLDGRTLNEGEFSFTMTASGDYGDAVSPTSITATNTVNEDGTGSVVFGDGFVFTEPGTYTFTISEDAGSLGGVSYDGSEYTATAVVTDDGAGNLNVAWTVADADGNAVSEITFENTYSTSSTTPVDLRVSKELQNDTLAEGQFTFELTGSDGAPMPEGATDGKLTATNDANGVVNFGEITFDAVGEYDYTVTEINDGQEGITYDENTDRTIHVSVTDNGEGSLEAEVSYGDDGSHFVNVGTPDEPSGGGGTDGSGSEGGSGESSGDDGSSLLQTGDYTGYLLGALVAIFAAASAVTVIALRKSQNIHGRHAR